MSINRASSCKCLGIIVNETLTWSDHTGHMKSKINKNIICGCEYLSHVTICFNISISFILQYRMGLERLKSLHILYKRSICATFHLYPSSSCKLQFLEHNLLNIYQLNLFKIGLFMYNYVNNLLTSSFTYLFDKSSVRHRIYYRYKSCMCHQEYLLMMTLIDSLHIT